VKVVLNWGASLPPEPFAGEEGEALQDRIRCVWARLLLAEGTLPSGEETREAEVSVSFVDPNSMAELNRTYRQVEGPTDVLSFPLWEEEGRFCPPPWEVLPLGDVVICPEQVQPQEGGGSKERQMLLVLHHGFLHLLGWDHDTPQKEQDMWELQERMVSDTLEGNFAPWAHS